MQLESLNIPPEGSQALNTNVGYEGDHSYETPSSQPQNIISPEPIQHTVASTQVSMAEFQKHIQDAVRSVSEAMQFPSYQHVATTVDGSKRAHIEPAASTPSNSSLYTPTTTQQQAYGYNSEPVQNSVPINTAGAGQQASVPQAAPLAMPQAAPLAMPQPLPNHFMPTAPAGPANPPAVAPVPIPATQFDQGGTSATHPQAFVQQTQLAMNTQQQPPQTFNMPTSGGPAGGQNFQMGQNSSLPSLTTMSTTINGQTFCIPVATNSTVPTPAPPPPRAASGKVGHPSCQVVVDYLTLYGLQACRIQGCDASAVSRRPYCVKHSGNRLCEHPGCTKCAQGSTRFCIAHGGGRRCTYPGCDKGARDKHFCAA